VYARLTVEPVRRALEAQAQRILGPRPPVNAAPTPAGPAAVSSPVEERAEPQEWPANYRPTEKVRQA
jgi:hypothetical protein